MDVGSTSGRAPAVPVSPVGVETEAAVVAAAVTVVGTLAAAVFFDGSPAPLWGGNSIGAATAAAAFGAGLVAGLMGYWRSRYQPGHDYRQMLPTWRLILDGLSVALVHAVIAATAPVGYLLLQRSFGDPSIHPAAAAMIVGFGCGLAVYWTYTSVFALTIGRLYGLFVVLVMLNVVAGMASVQDHTWWQHNFSRLGDPSERSGELFNVTLVAAGIFLTTFASHLQRELQRLHERHLLQHAWSAGLTFASITASGVLLVGVGVFPSHGRGLLHISCAVAMTISFASLMILSPVVLAGLPVCFHVGTYGSLAALIACTVLVGPVRYLNLTAYELCTSVIIFCWIALLVRFLDALGSTVTPPAAAGSTQGVRPADPAAARPAASADLTVTGRSGILRGGAEFSRTPRSGRR
ncbi:hypothetical protein C4K88_04415 [Arthrobacter pityocampae]|uniref:DUF998 domain-containing protein n=1 Tax=Arthrobacter pityocampae TaxID=547334 RepID=A0A2S5IZH3_9MICC|nr:hypothetical protein [Arthrobacter pityocampae]PPB49937.1 hypothetical protein C4K88_04415 [Arthrobacter pityocampae]